MDHLSIKLNLGIGDIVFTKAALDNVKDQYEVIKVSPNYPLIDQYRNGDPEYRQFVDDLFKLLFSEPPYEIVDDQNLPSKTPYTLMHENNMELCKPDLAKYFVDPVVYYDDCKEHYITVSTKVRGLSATDYVMKYRERLIDKLQELSEKHTIYIIGEKRIGYNAEYSQHGDTIFCIYDDLRYHLEKALDICIPELGETAPKLNYIKDDCTLMYAAKSNICLGIGGNFSLAASVGNLINFRAAKGDAVDCSAQIFDNTGRVFSTDDFDLFIQKLGELNNGYNGKSY